MVFGIEGIPVVWDDLQQVGTAHLKEDDYGVLVEIRFDVKTGIFLRDNAERGTLTGLSIGAEMTPARRSRKPTQSFYEGRAAYGERES